MFRIVNIFARDKRSRADPAHRGGHDGGDRIGAAHAHLRKPLVDSDRVLVSRTHVWLRSIPGRSQPKQLCRHFPRVANLIAASWDDVVLTDRVLIDLLSNERGSRAGFPSRVVAELQLLLRMHAQRTRFSNPTALPRHRQMTRRGA